MTDQAPQPPRNVIHLPLITRGGVSTGRGEAMRAAVVQVITNLVVRRVPPAERLPDFDQAADLLDTAGRSPIELLEAAEPGPEQERLFKLLGI